MTLQSIKKIKELGLFNNYQSGSSLHDFARYNLIYGWNGSGKTTLSKLFACLENGSSADFPNLKYEIKYKDGHEDGITKDNTQFNQKIRVFNQDYIHKNVQLIDGKANPIFILGEENKEIVDKVKADENTLADLKNQKTAKETEKKTKEDDKDAIFSDIAKSISKNLIDSSTRYTQTSAKKDFKPLSEKKILNDDEIKEQEAIIKQEKKEKIDKINFDANLDLSNTYEEITNICTETVEINVIDRLTENQDISAWVEHGLTFHTKDSEKCEFCNSSLPSGRIEALLGHFNEVDKKLKTKIDRKITSLQKIIQSVEEVQFPNKAQFYKDLQTSFASQTTTYEQEKNNYCNELLDMVEFLNTKKQKTTEQINFSKSPGNNFQLALDSVNETIDQHNQKSDNFKREKDEAFKLLKKHYLSERFDEIYSLDSEIKECETEISRLQNGKKNTSFVGIAELKQQIAENKNKILSEHNACDRLNKKLKIFLGRDEIKFEIAPEGGYVITHNGVIAKNLSEGEKTAIAFVYFVVHLQDENFDKDNGIIVIDDPVSSLDSNSQFQAFAFLKNAVKGAKQVFIFTHSFSFLKLILYWLNKTKKHQRQYYMIRNKHSTTGGRTAFISHLDKTLEEHESEYHYLFKILYDFKTDGSKTDESIDSVYPIPNIARKVLDTFLMFRVPNGENSHEKMKKLKFDENKKAAIHNFTNDQSHITGDGLDPSLVPEALKNVKYLLEMIKKVFPEHYQILEEQCKKQSSVD